MGRAVNKLDTGSNNSIFDVNKANQDLQLAKQGKSVPGMQIMGYNNDKINEQDPGTITPTQQQNKKTPDEEYVRSKSFKFSNATEPEAVNVSEGVENTNMNLDPRKKAIMNIFKGGV